MLDSIVTIGILIALAGSQKASRLIVDCKDEQLMPDSKPVHDVCCSGDAVLSHGPSCGRVRPPDGATTSRFRITNMDCPTEEALIRSKLGSLPGVAALDFNLMQRILVVHHAPNALPGVVQALQSIGFKPERLADADVHGPAAARLGRVHTPVHWGVLGLALAAAAVAEGVYWIQGGNHWLVIVLALAAIALSGVSTYKKGLIALRNRTLNINALMAIAVTGAVLIGHWPEAAMVMALFALAEAIEARSLDRARNAIQGLLQLAPEHAQVQQPNGDWSWVGTALVRVGSRVRVGPGERIALDGRVLEGRSAVNQAPITGESLPVEKAVGDPVFAGTININGALEFQVTAAADHSTLARIIHAVEQAQGRRAPTQRFVDQFARWYTPLVCLLALGVALMPALLPGLAWLDWVYRALVLLVVACPCALVISTPVTIVSGLSAAARHGILVKGGAYLEQGRWLEWLALDKTGTLTQGRPVQTDFVVVSAGSGLAKPAWLRCLVASLAGRSDHPVSRALALAAQADAIQVSPVSGFEALPGRGVRGVINGRLFYLGNHRLIKDLGAGSPDLGQRIDTLEAQGKSVVMLVHEQTVLALAAVADTLKETSREAIDQLHALGIKTLMLTGDNLHAARVIACQVGVQQVQGDLLPEEKARQVEHLARQGRVGMVGDGINDAPALAQAHIGFAMGAAGSDIAIETADVALMDDDLRKIPLFVRLSRATARVLKQNIALALGIKAVFVVLTFTGDATLWMAVFADMGASLLVVGNGLRLLRR